MFHSKMRLAAVLAAAGLGIAPIAPQAMAHFDNNFSPTVNVLSNNKNCSDHGDSSWDSGSNGSNSGDDSSERECSGQSVNILGGGDDGGLGLPGGGLPSGPPCLPSPIPPIPGCVAGDFGLPGDPTGLLGSLPVDPLALLADVLGANAIDPAGLIGTAPSGSLSVNLMGRMISLSY